MLKSFRTSCALTSCFFLSAFTNAQGDWDQFQGNAQHTGVADSSINAPLLKSAWSVSGTFESATVGNSGVAIVDGSVYATRLTNNWFAGPYVIGRYNGTNGAVTWSTSLASNGGYSAPSVAGNTVYVHKFGHSGTSGGTPDQHPALIGLDSATGIQKFRTNHEGQWSSGSRPTIQGNTVLAAGGYSGGLDSYKLDGSRNWSLEMEQQYGWIAAADDTNAYGHMGTTTLGPGPGTGGLFTVNLSTGAQAAISDNSPTLDFPLEDGVVLGGRSDALSLGLVDFNGNASLTSFDLLNQDVSWRVIGGFTGNPAVANGLLYIADRNQLRVLDQITGATAWTWAGSRNVNGSVVVAGNYAFVNANGSVHAIELDTRQSVWNSNGVSGSIAIDGNLLVISNQTGLYAFTAVPEPISVVCLAAGLGAIGFRRFRHRKSAPVKV